MINMLNPRIKRFGILGIGLSVNQLMVWAFDFVLYPFVIWRLGLLTGGAVMTSLSFVTCYCLIRFYDWTKKDWLGIETIKNLKESTRRSRLARATAWILKKGDPAAMIILSIRFDPFITTTYMRHGSHEFNGLAKRDWQIFIGSLFIANAYWSIAMFSGVSIAEWLWLQTKSGF